MAFTTTAILLLTSACSSEGGPTGNAEGTTAISSESVLTEAELAAYMAEASDFVRPLIEDGVVTAGEYEQATFRVIQCLDEAGIDHTEPVLDVSQRVPQWTFGVRHDSDEELARESPIFYACEEDYVSTVLEIWARQEAPSEAEMQAIIVAVLACLKEAGIEAGSWEEANTLVREGLLTEEQMEARRLCMVEHYVGVNPNASN